MSWLNFFLIFSLFLNIFFLWYIKNILAKLLYTSDNLGDLYIVFRSFEEFVESIYNMEVYHGEPTIEELLKRSKDTRQELEKFKEIYELTTTIEEVQADETEEKEEAKT